MQMYNPDYGWQGVWGAKRAKGVLSGWPMVIGTVLSACAALDRSEFAVSWFVFALGPAFCGGGFTASDDESRKTTC